MNTENLLKNKWAWIIGGVVLLIIIIASGNEEQSVSMATQPQVNNVQQETQVKELTPVSGGEEKSVSETSQSQVKKVQQETQTKELHPETSQEQQVKVLFPVKQLINKTPSEIESLTGADVIDWGKNTTGTLMTAGINLQGLSMDTAFILVKHPKVKYNGATFFNIQFDSPVNEDDAWKIVGLSKPNKEQAYTHSTNSSKFTWRNIPPFFEVQATHPYRGNTLIVDKDKIEFIEVYLLTEDEDMELY